MVHTEYEAAVDHHAKIVQPANSGGVVAADVLEFALLLQIVAVHGLESDKEAAHSACTRLCQHSWLLKHGFHSARRLPQPIHSEHAVEERFSEGRASEEVVVQEVQMAPRQPVDLGQGGVDGLRAELLVALEEDDLVAEGAERKEYARDHYRLRH